MSEKAWLDIAVIRCPNCGHFYADASWYIIEIGSDIECGTCHKTFNTKKHATDRIMLSLKIDGKGRVQQAEDLLQTQQKAQLIPHPKLERIRLLELEKPENARWLALLIDTEGALGWRKHISRRNRIDKEYRYVYTYRVPYISVSMLELESKETINEASRLLGVLPFIDKREGKIFRAVRVGHIRARTAMRHMLPHAVKFKRMIILCLTLFKYRVFIRIETFDRVITTLFGRYVSPKQANPILLKMTQTQFHEFIRKAEELTKRYLK